MAIYRDVVRELLQRCEDYREGRLALADFKSAIWGATQVIVAVEERSLRDFLQRAEGRLDVLEHMTDAEKVFSATLPVVSEIEGELRRSLESMTST